MKIRFAHLRSFSLSLSLSPFRQSFFTLLQEKNTKIESLAAQVADLTQQVQMQEQLKKDLIQEKAASASQLKEQHSIEVTKQKAMLEDACKHYQNTLKEEQLKLELMSQQLESAKSDIVALNSKASKKESQKALVMELQDHISSLEKDLEETVSEKKCLEKSHAKTSHLLSIAEQCASSLEADRYKLMQEIATLSQSQAALEKNAEVQSKEVEKRQVRSNFAFMQC
jgi:chromosome segregation ATPase